MMRDLKALTCGEFARKYNFRLRRVYDLRAYLGAPRKNTWLYKFSDVSSEAYRDLSLYSDAVVARKYGCSPCTITKIRKRLGVKKHKLSAIDRIPMTAGMLRDLNKLTHEAFAAKHHINPIYIYRLQLKYNLVRKPFLSRLDRAQKEELVRMPLEEAARRFGVSTRTMHRALRKLGVKKHRPTLLERIAMTEGMLQDLKQLSYRGFAAKHHLSTFYVYKLKVKYNLIRKPLPARLDHS